MVKKWLTSLAVGTALMGAGVVVGSVSNQVNQPSTVQAKTKMKKVTIKKEIWKDGRWHNFTTKVPYGKTTPTIQPYYKGYKDIEGGTITNIKIYKNGEAQWGASPFIFMKVISAKQQTKNAKSKNAVTVKDKLDYMYYTRSGRRGLREKTVKYTTKGLIGTMVKIKTPKVAGLKRKQKTINIGIMGKNRGVQQNDEKHRDDMIYTNK